MFEVSVHRATTALEKLNSRCNALPDEAMQVCVHRETIDTAQMGQVQLGAWMMNKVQRIVGRPPLFELPPVQSLRIRPLRGMAEEKGAGASGCDTLAHLERCSSAKKQCIDCRSGRTAAK